MKWSTGDVPRHVASSGVDSRMTVCIKDKKSTTHRSSGCLNPSPQPATTPYRKCCLSSVKNVAILFHFFKSRHVMVTITRMKLYLTVSRFN